MSLLLRVCVFVGDSDFTSLQLRVVVRMSYIMCRFAARERRIIPAFTLLCLEEDVGLFCVTLTRRFAVPCSLLLLVMFPFLS